MPWILYLMVKNLNTNIYIFPILILLRYIINDKVAVEITYRVHTHSIYTELETSFKKELFTEYEIDFIDKYAQEFLTEKSKGN